MFEKCGSGSISGWDVCLEFQTHPVFAAVCFGKPLKRNFVTEAKVVVLLISLRKQFVDKNAVFAKTSRISIVLR